MLVSGPPSTFPLRGVFQECWGHKALCSSKVLGDNCFILISGNPPDGLVERGPQEGGQNISTRIKFKNAFPHWKRGTPKTLVLTIWKTRVAIPNPVSVHSGRVRPNVFCFGGGDRFCVGCLLSWSSVTFVPKSIWFLLLVFFSLVDVFPPFSPSRSSSYNPCGIWLFVCLGILIVNPVFVAIVTILLFFQKLSFTWFLVKSTLTWRFASSIIMRPTTMAC